MKNILDLRFTDDEVQAIRASFDPERYQALRQQGWAGLEADEARRRRLLNKLRAKPVREVLMQKYRRAVQRLEAILDEPIMSAVIVVGDDKASQIYVDTVIKACVECGVQPIVFRLRPQDGQTRLMRIMRFVQATSDIHGVILQNPLPPGDPHDPFNLLDAYMRLPEFKDIDCSNLANVAKLAISKNADILLPATQGGLIMAIELFDIPMRKANGKAVDVGMVGQGRLVGRPTAMVLMDRYGITPELFSIDSDRIPERLREKDIIIAATGQPEVLGREILNPGKKQYLLDMGVHQVGERTVGDFSAELNDEAYAIMKSPGGSGSFTTLYLIHNMLLSAARRARQLRPGFTLYADESETAPA